jgi:hypothetical protein
MNITEDPEKVLDELGEHGKFVEDKDTGTEYYKPSQREYETLNAEFFSEIRQAQKDHAGFYQRIQENERAYEGHVDMASGEKPMLVIPVVRRECDATAAWFINTLMRPNPIFSIDPCFPNEYKVPVDDPAMGRMLLDTAAEQVAAGLELAVQYIVNERIKIRHLMDVVINETVRGRGPSVVKVVFDEKYQDEFVTNIEEGPLKIPRVNGVRRVSKQQGDPVRVYPIPAENFLMPSDEELTLTARWVAERVPLRSYAIRAEMKKARCLVPKAEWTDLETATGEVSNDTLKEAKASVDGRAISVPRHLHDTWEVWFEHYVESEKRIVKMLGLYHVGIQRFIWITRNPYHHQRNPYVAFFQKKRPFRFSGSSTADEMLTVQKLASEILHLALQNAIVHNSAPIVADPDSDAIDFLTEHEIDSTTVIPARPEEVKVLDFGRTHPGLMNELSFVMGLSRSPGNSQYDDGSYIPGRTSPNTVEMIMQSGKNVPLQQLQGYADGFCEVIWLYLKVYKQFRPYGEILYTQNAETRQMLEIPFRLPDEDALDNFRITMTAADEIAAEETNIEQITMLANLLDKDADQLAKILGPLVDMNMPDSLEALLAQLIQRKQEVIEMYVKRIRTDTNRFVISQQMLRSVAEEKRLMKEQAMAQQAAMAGAPQGGPVGPGNVPPPQMAGAA